MREIRGTNAVAGFYEKLIGAVAPGPKGCSGRSMNENHPYRGPSGEPPDPAFNGSITCVTSVEMRIKDS